MRLESRQLPTPHPAQFERSVALAARIRDEIERSGGWMRFDRYMQMALYEPGLGYYGAPSVQLGADGDFTTAAELGTLLPRAIAAWCNPLFGELDAPVILELGAGTGALAATLLEELTARGRQDLRYLILEPSASLRLQQQQRLQAFADRVAWLDRLPEMPLEGLILANEVADALPVVRFTKSARGALPIGVAVEDQGFRWQVGREDQELERAVDCLEERLPAVLPQGYRAEICLMLEAWVGALADCLSRGALLVIDYGLPRRELYHTERSDGTLICHYRHRAHGDPFIWPGLQDLSAWVDFSACADAGRSAGLTVSGFTTQAQFLLETAAAGAAEDGRGGIVERNAMKTLLLPGEMGERFKVLLMTRALARCGLPGRDFRGRL
jgi:SAM-dependent MidA family methyltransferase